MSYLCLFGTSPATSGYTADRSSSSSSSSTRSISPSSDRTSASSFSTTTTSSTSPKKRTETIVHPPCIPICNNGAPIQLPVTQERLSKPRRPTLDKACSASSSDERPSASASASTSASAMPVLRPLRPGEQYAGNIGLLDASTVTVEVEVSSEAARKAERSIWYIPRH